MLPHEPTFVNAEAELARSFIIETDVSVFLTGSAGTGKTTFLRSLTAAMPKQMLIAAPTGVAAINAGGMTLHSLFGLPLRMYFPTRDRIDPNLGNNTDMLVGHFHYSKEKRQLLQTLELLVIDEISMVRADIFDAIDLALRFVRRNPAPFGGVQLLLIGDLAQLPPVLREEEREAFEKYYKGPFFFQSKVWDSLQAVQIQLQHIYRQRDPRFINLLNNLRENRITPEDRILLNSRRQQPTAQRAEHSITLTSHNRKAENMNQDALARLPGKAVCFNAEIKGEINEAQVPAEKELYLKPGAQIMFIRNDSSGERAYFNGKIGILTDFDDEQLQVHFPETDKHITVGRETWENIRYRFDTDKQAIQEHTVGTYKQFPVRLAWAVTIHKSQGLTFDHAVIDAGESFAAGQVYVALSRCRSLEGLVLSSEISDRSLFTDPHVAAFLSRQQDPEAMERRLTEGRDAKMRNDLRRIFHFSDLLLPLQGWYQDSRQSTKAPANRLEDLYATTTACISRWKELEPRLAQQWETLFSAQPADEQLIREKLKSALNWYAGQIQEKLLPPWDSFLTDLLRISGTRTVFRHSLAFREVLSGRLLQLHRFAYRGTVLMEETASFAFPAAVQEALESESETPEGNRAKKRKGNAPVKGESLSHTRSLFREGKEPEQIAALRNLKASTIEGHFKQLIQLGEVKVEELINPANVQRIRQMLEENTGLPLRELIENHGQEFRPAEVYWVHASMPK